MNIPSDWSATANEAFTSGLNPESLTHARKLHTTGTTCDAYDARINGVRVFIKILKSEYDGKIEVYDGKISLDPAPFDYIFGESFKSRFLVQGYDSVIMHNKLSKTTHLLKPPPR